MTETHIFPSKDILSYELMIRYLVRKGFKLNERKELKPNSFALRNTGENNIIYVEKSIDCPGQSIMNLGVS